MSIDDKRRIAGLPPKPSRNGKHAPAKKVGHRASVRPVITIGQDEHRVNDEAVAALAGDPEMYARAGQLVRVVNDDEEQSVGKIVYPAGPRISPVSAATLRERLTLVADWLKFDQKKRKNVPTTPPQPNTLAVLDRGKWPGVRRLTAVVEYPVLLPGGGILTTPGYDRDSGLIYSPRASVRLSIPNSPTMADAKRAADVLLDVVSEFPFAEEYHRAAWLAGLLSPLARFAYRGPSPLFLVEGNTPGCGKGLLCDCTSIIVRGSELAVTTFPANGDEFRKRVTSILIRGCSMVLFDNLAGKFGGAELDALLTSTVWSDRVLGESRTVEVPVFTTWFGTGNNVVVTGDTIRRVCPMRLESTEERPEERTDIKRDNLRGWVSENRPALLSAALTMLRAYHAAGRPKMKLPKWGSYEGWSDIVRDAIVWAGLPDPWLGRQAMREDRGDDKIAAIGAILRDWSLIDPFGDGLTAAAVVKKIDELPADSESSEALSMLVGYRPTDGKPDKRASGLGRCFRDNDSRSIGGKRIVKVGGRAGVNRWGVHNLDVVRTLTGDGGDDGDGGDGGDGGDTSSYPTRAHAHTIAAENIPTIPTIPTTQPDPAEQTERDAIAEFGGG